MQPHIFEKIFSWCKILFVAADGMAHNLVPCHLLAQQHIFCDSYSNILLLDNSLQHPWRKFGLCKIFILINKTPGVFTEASYGTLSRDTLTTVNRLNNFTGMVLSDNQIWQITKLTKLKEGRSSAAVSSGWEQRISEEEKNIIDEECKELYAITDYKP